MTKLLPILLSVLFCGTLAAQVELTDAYFPVAGDTLRTNVADSAFASTVMVGTAGADQAWNFGDPTIVDVRSIAVTSAVGNEDFPNASISIQTAPGTESFYSVNATSFDLIGIRASVDLFPNVNVLTEVAPVRPTRRAPLRFGDEFSTEATNSVAVPRDSLPQELLDQLGALAASIDSARIRTISVRTDKVDAYGNARLGDNFYDVLREQRAERLDVRLDFKTFVGWQDVTGQVRALLPEFAGALGVQPELVTYFFWSPDSKEPIAEVTTLGETGTVTSFVYKRALQATSTQGPGVSRAELRVFPNPATELATFEISGLEVGNYTLSLMNSMAQRIEQRQFSPLGDRTRLTMEVGHLPSGMYLYSLINERGRVMTTKRLMVR